LIKNQPNEFGGYISVINI